MSDKSPFNAHDACLKIELPCDQRFLQMFEQFTLKVSQSFGYRGGGVDEFSQLISGLTGTVLKASELMPFSHLSVELSALEKALAVRVEYHTDGLDENVSSQRIKHVLNTLNKENVNWNEMANSFEFSYVDGVDCCTVALPLPQNDEQAGNQ